MFVAFSRRWRWALLVGLGVLMTVSIGSQLYWLSADPMHTWTRDNRTSSERQFSYDVTTGRRNPATARSFADDVRSNPRELVVGDTWATATPAGSGGNVESGILRAVATRLVAFAGETNGESPTTAF